MGKVAYPGRSTPASYKGPHTPCRCPDCGRTAYLPPWVTDGKRRYCGRCDGMVAWEEF